MIAGGTSRAPEAKVMQRRVVAARQVPEYTPPFGGPPPSTQDLQAACGNPLLRDKRRSLTTGSFQPSVRKPRCCSFEASPQLRFVRVCMLANMLASLLPPGVEEGPVAAPAARSHQLCGGFRWHLPRTSGDERADDMTSAGRLLTPLVAPLAVDPPDDATTTSTVRSTRAGHVPLASCQYGSVLRSVMEQLRSCTVCVPSM